MTLSASDEFSFISSQVSIAFLLSLCEVWCSKSKYVHLSASLKNAKHRLTNGVGHL